ncbi:Zn-ribbon domain-containing OB-fold protein [Comamonas endophytica]|uniref:OB-fold domain-containing protein n=1 Tax=Comamonas endophytica TaxID=2949090 RepID=A0ABY6GGG9_9BURK|nr:MULTISPECIES: OB-fold domain-containing protein [unclassified Acidovorax]MCD2513230.1 OB-fold domain-containing protein [Acidovorax sp. D4N7]UYG53425.1 OB-fold domain-containing protein [Acidovorax sp. 5MLIR]
MAALSKPFVDGLDAQVVRYQHCLQCGQAQTLARHACQECGSQALEWLDASGAATVRAAAVVSRAPSDAFRALAPYTLVIAELDEGPRLMGHADAGIAIGTRVKAHFFRHQERTLVRFAAIE